MTRARVTSSRQRAGAVAIIELRATPGELTETLRSIAGVDVPVGSVRLRSLAGVDSGLVLRPGEAHALLTPHGGVGVVRALQRALEARGVVFDEAEPEDETSRLERALAAAPSPLAVDLLLDQARRVSAGVAPVPDGVARALDRLILPPTVVVVGAANIGKSSLLNALAQRPVAVVADEPGTTRDHVGAMIDCAGLVVRWVDTPGLRAGGGAVESAARRAALGLLPAADLVLLASDPAAPAPGGLDVGGESMVVGLRGDLGDPASPADVVVSAREPGSLVGLVAAVRDRLVPPLALADPGVWAFPAPGEVAP